MTNQAHARSTLVVRDIQSMKPRVAFAILLLILAGVMSVVSGSPPAYAEDRQHAASAQAMSTPGKININTADAPALAANLNGVGESRAQDIVRHRETYGPFASAEELMEVKGIGQSTLDKNRDLITLE